MKTFFKGSPIPLKMKQKIEANFHCLSGGKKLSYTIKLFFPPETVYGSPNQINNLKLSTEAILKIL